MVFTNAEAGHSKTAQLLDHFRSIPVNEVIADNFNGDLRDSETGQVAFTLRGLIEMHLDVFNPSVPSTPLAMRTTAQYNGRTPTAYTMPAPLTVGVVGPTGFAGSHITVELLDRGHKVVGISRHPETLGSRPGYTPKSVDVQSSSIVELAEAFRGLDVLISCYGPHTSGPGGLLYSTWLDLPACWLRYPVLSYHIVQQGLT